LAVRIDRNHAYFPRLGERANRGPAAFSGGEQQMLAISRALMAKTDPAHAR
jgi:ABC-type branched-subunit amino acid transport system ATPase component